MTKLVALMAMHDQTDQTDPVVYEVVLVPPEEADRRLWQLRARYLKITPRKLAALHKRHYEDTDGEEATDEDLVNWEYSTHLTDHGKLRIERAEELVIDPYAVVALPPTTSDLLNQLRKWYNQRRSNVGVDLIMGGIRMPTDYWIAFQGVVERLFDQTTLEAQSNDLTDS